MRPSQCKHERECSETEESDWSGHSDCDCPDHGFSESERESEEPLENVKENKGKIAKQESEPELGVIICDFSRSHFHHCSREFEYRCPFSCAYEPGYREGEGCCRPIYFCDGISLERESWNAYDRNAIKIMSTFEGEYGGKEMEQVGYVPKELASTLAREMDANSVRLKARLWGCTRLRIRVLKIGELKNRNRLEAAFNKRWQQGRWNRI